MPHVSERHVCVTCVSLNPKPKHRTVLHPLGVDALQHFFKIRIHDCTVSKASPWLKFSECGRMAGGRQVGRPLVHGLLCRRPCPLLGSDPLIPSLQKRIRSTPQRVSNRGIILDSRKQKFKFLHPSIHPFATICSIRSSCSRPIHPLLQNVQSSRNFGSRGRSSPRTRRHHSCDS